MRHIAIIGAGITGVTTAYALSEKGYAVTVFDRNRYAAMETSFANGGQLSASNAEVWNHWSTVWKGMKWMLRGDAPLLVNPRPSWHKLSWFAEFVGHIGRYRDNTIETARLAIAAREHLFAWAQAEGVDFDLRREGILHIYRDKAGFDHAAEVSKLLAQGGLERRAVTPEEMRAIEPTLTSEQRASLAQLRSAPEQSRQTPTRIAVIWVLRNNRPHPVRVQLGVSDDNYTELRGGELQPNDKIIIGGGPRDEREKQKRRGPMGGPNIRIRGA